MSQQQFTLIIIKCLNNPPFQGYKPAVEFGAKARLSPLKGLCRYRMLLTNVTGFSVPFSQRNGAVDERVPRRVDPLLGR
jgi:hypothetical protein